MWGGIIDSGSIEKEVGGSVTKARKRRERNLGSGARMIGVVINADRGCREVGAAHFVQVDGI